MTPVAVLGVVAGVLLVWLPVLALHLTSALLTALLIYAGTRAVAARLARTWPALHAVRPIALLLILLALAGVIMLAFSLVPEAHEGPGAIGRLIQTMAGTLEQLRAMLPPWLSTHLPVTVDAVRTLSVDWLRNHSGVLQGLGGNTLLVLGHIVVGAGVGALAALQMPPPAQDGAPLAAGLRRHLDGLVQAFTNVVFAQARIAAINAVLTAVFLMGVLPLLGRPLPMAGLLVVLTFLTGLLPVVGNLISNTVIVVVGLSQSMVVALLALAWLVGIHKLEYFLNAHIIGTRIRAKAWELLTVMLLFEAAFGLAGLVAAPILYAQLKQALQARGWL